MKAGGSAITIIQKTLKALSKVKAAKIIRLGVGGHDDVLKKGFHIHIKGYKFELGIKALDNGKIGLVQDGKKVGTALDVKNAAQIFEQAIGNTVFREKLLI